MMTKRITITLFYCIDGATGRVERRRHATLRGCDGAAIDFLRRTVRGYRGPTSSISETYARKVQARASAAGFSVTVKEKPKPTPSEAKASARKAFAYVRARLVADAEKESRRSVHH